MPVHVYSAHQSTQRNLVVTAMEKILPLKFDSPYYHNGLTQPDGIYNCQAEKANKKGRIQILAEINGTKTMICIYQTGTNQSQTCSSQSYLGPCLVLIFVHTLTKQKIQIEYAKYPALTRSKIAQYRAMYVHTNIVKIRLMRRRLSQKTNKQICLFALLLFRARKTNLYVHFLGDLLSVLSDLYKQL